MVPPQKTAEQWARTEAAETLRVERARMCIQTRGGCRCEHTNAWRADGGVSGNHHGGVAIRPRGHGATPADATGPPGDDDRIAALVDSIASWTPSSARLPLQHELDLQTESMASSEWRTSERATAGEGWALEPIGLSQTECEGHSGAQMS